MKIFAREHAADYANYRFSYGLFAEWESGDSADQFWSQGFLPYSADPKTENSTFYMARSLRVPIAELQFDKKKRYQIRNSPLASLELKTYSKDEYLKQNSASFEARVHQWMQARHGESYLSPERLRYILTRPFLNTILELSDNDAPRATALVCRSGNAAHYWFAFYDPQHHPQSSPGKHLLARFLQWCQQEHITHAYLGTAYGTKSSYKFQGIQPVQFWDGKQWNEDMDTLLELLSVQC